MSNVASFRIPNSDFDEFEDEPIDELASAGFRIVDASAVDADDDEDKEEEDDGLDDEGEDPLVIPIVEEEKVVADPEIMDGLKELEEMEKNYIDEPVVFDDPEE